MLMYMMGGYITGMVNGDFGDMDVEYDEWRSAEYIYK